MNINSVVTLRLIQGVNGRDSEAVGRVWIQPKQNVKHTSPLSFNLGRKRALKAVKAGGLQEALDWYPPE